ncbi:MAG: hypothetical protein Q4C65_02420 [Eubacteriales bacterium]|nr:hypothetical protein [Eubacteriales bacterium]
MLSIVVPAGELWDESKQEFIAVKEQKLQLEHSLVSIAKWERTWNKPFLSKKELSTEETTDYIRCMTITQNVDPNTYRFVTGDNLRQINAYMEAPMTAAWFKESGKGKMGREQITAEIIYYWMISHGIPFECQKWHLNSLLALIRTCNAKNQPPKKMSSKEIARSNSAINAARRKMLNSKG